MGYLWASAGRFADASPTRRPPAALEITLEHPRTRLGIDPAAALAALIVLGLAPVIGMLIAGRANVVGMGTALICAELVLLMRPMWAVYLLMVGSIFNDIWFNAGFALLGLGDLTTFALLPVWVLHRFIALDGWRVPVRWPLLFGYMGLALASLLAGVAPDAGLRPYLRQATYILALFAVVDLLRDTDKVATVFRLLALCGALHAAYALATWPGGGRLEGIPKQSNALAIMLSFCAVPTVGLVMHTRRQFARLCYAGMLGLMLIAMILTISRGMYLSFGLAMLWWLRGSRRMIALLVVAAVGIGVFLSQRSETASHIQSRFAMRDISVVNRLKVQENALKAIAERPLLGLGFAQFTEIDRAVDVNAEAGRGTHNHYLGTVASSGLPAALLLFGFVLAQFLPLFRRHGPYQRFAERERWLVDTMQALAIYQTVSLAVRNTARQPEWMILAIYCALLAIALSREKAPPDAAHQPSGISSSPGGGASS